MNIKASCPVGSADCCAADRSPARRFRPLVPPSRAAITGGVAAVAPRSRRPRGADVGLGSEVHHRSSPTQVLRRTAAAPSGAATYEDQAFRQRPGAPARRGSSGSAGSWAGPDQPWYELESAVASSPWLATAANALVFRQPCHLRASCTSRRQRRWPAIHRVRTMPEAPSLADADRTGSGTTRRP